MEYQWYPGHMTKARRMMEENVRLVDLVIEILDARVPLSSRNPDIDVLAKGKERLIILGKSDLADPKRTEEFLSYFEAGHVQSIAADLRTGKEKKKILKAISCATKSKRKWDEAHGMRRPVRVMVCGIPNVGKSTLINTLTGRKSAKTGNRPGVTKGKQWIHLDQLDLLDTPGILWPKFEDQNVGIRLSIIGSIREEILDEEELALHLLDILLPHYLTVLEERYFSKVTDRQRKEWEAKESFTIQERQSLLEELALTKGLLLAGGRPDMRRASHLLLSDFRSGKLGCITLDTPGDLDVQNEEVIET